MLILEPVPVSNWQEFTAEDVEDMGRFMCHLLTSRHYQPPGKLLKILRETNYHGPFGNYDLSKYVVNSSPLICCALGSIKSFVPSTGLTHCACAAS